MPALRVSAISFLNTAPLMWDFQHGAVPPDFEVSYDVPSTCADKLRAGQADLGIIPSIAYQAIPDLSVLPGVAIASKHAVRSILLVSKVPLEQIDDVCLDTSSRTSVALLKIILEKWCQGGRGYFDMPPDLNAMLKRADAALLIGDSALRVRHEGLFVYDLAEMWRECTGKPFVFAFWAVRAEAVRPGLAEVFQRSRDHGLEPANLEVIADEWAARLGLTYPAVVSYLTQNIHYDLDAENLAGLRLFYDYAAELNLIETVKELRFTA